MRRTKPVCSWRLMLVSAAMIASAAGCASMQSMMPASTPSQKTTAAEIPRVEDCLIMNISSPSKYVCNGKTYTTFQLAKMRMAEEKKYASGK